MLIVLILLLGYLACFSEFRLWILMCLSLLTGWDATVRVLYEWVCTLVLCTVDSRCSLGRWRAVCSMMDGRFILSSSLFLLSVCITQISPVHVSAVLFNPANSSHLSSVYTSERAACVCPERIRNTECAFTELQEYLRSGRDEWVFNASPAGRLILIRVHQSPAVWSPSRHRFLLVQGSVCLCWIPRAWN